MSADISTLTDKEKEALRLLLEGHDTKSSANLLGLSVHTINDRLRNARRKMGVGSSREAARILRDVEGETPKNTPQTSAEDPQSAPETNAHTSFGMSDQAPPSDTAVLTQTHQKEPNRLIWLAGGMLIMSIVIAAAVIAMVSTSGTEATTAAAPATTATTAAASADTLTARDAEAYGKAQRFLSEVDAGDWKGSWDVAGDFIQSQVSADQWEATVKPVREPLGDVTSREFASLQQTNSLPNAPEGEYEVLQFTTTFANQEAPRTETVIMIRTEEGFDVAGFFIR